ncbi:MAG: ParB/RepB/Spo0J family partition protein [Candidatus Kuenenbacteria bacterium]
MNHSLYNHSDHKIMGRGLSSLIPNKEQKTSQVRGPVSSASYFPKSNAKVSNQILHVSPSQIQVNPYQPRKNFRERELEGLKDSIRQHGILQPLIATQTMGGKYELVAGERRLRAALDLSLKSVPVIVRTARDLEKLELSLIENLQREDLNSIEKAEGYKRLLDNFNLTQEEVAKRLGIARSSLNNTLRLLNLPDEVQFEIASGKVSEGQAKLLLGVSLQDQKKMLNKITMSHLTVKDVEREIRQIKIKPHIRTIKKDSQIKDWENKMQQVLGTRVFIRKRGQRGGLIEIEYYSDEELSGIVNSII